MTTNKTRGALQVYSSEYHAFELNAVLQRIREELDSLQGLRGRAEIFDNLKVATAPVNADDAVRKSDTIVVLGTGISVFAVGDLLYASQTDTLSRLAIGAANQLLRSTGTLPEWVADITVGVLTATSASLTTALPPGSGGTGLASYTIGDLLYASAAATLARLAAVATGRVLASAGVGAAPAWSATPSLTSLTLSGALTVGGGAAVTKILSASATLDFPNTLAQTSSDLTITVTGAADGDAVILGVPNAAVMANSSYSAWVSAADTVTVRFLNSGVLARDPASATFRVAVVQF